MPIEPSPVTPNQKRKVVKALLYSLGSGFSGGFILALTGVFQNVQNGGHVDVGTSLVIALIVGGVVGALNSAAVFVKQVFTPGE